MWGPLFEREPVDAIAAMTPKIDLMIEKDWCYQAMELIDPMLTARKNADHRRRLLGTSDATVEFMGQVYIDEQEDIARFHENLINRLLANFGGETPQQFAISAMIQKTDSGDKKDVAE